MGRWSRQVAAAFLDQLALPSALRWLDVGCGTGALTSTVLERCDPASVIGIDPSEGFVAWATEHVADRRVSFRVGTAEYLPARSADVVLSGLVLNFVPDVPAAVRSMRSAARDGGVVAAYVWDYAEGMQLLRHFWDAATALDPRARELDEGARFSVCSPHELERLWREAGLMDVVSGAAEVPALFSAFDDYWTPFLGGQGPAAGYVASLDDSGRTALRQRLAQQLPVEPDGSIRLTLRAWTVTGRA
jgi:trans-aconitate methyltransferase